MVSLLGVILGLGLTLLSAPQAPRPKLLGTGTYHPGGFRSAIVDFGEGPVTLVQGEIYEDVRLSHVYEDKVILTVGGRRHRIPLEAAEAQGPRPSFPPKPERVVLDPVQLLATSVDDQGRQTARVNLGRGARDFTAGIQEGRQTLLYAKGNHAFLMDHGGAILHLERAPAGTREARAAADAEARANQGPRCGTR